MTTQSLYCHSCKKQYNVRKEDIALMWEHDTEFRDNVQEYYGGCFFKNLAQIKRSLKSKAGTVNDDPTSRTR